ncbi:MAG: xanthine dehydrogenase family protein molybdopterin-binding subunit, partial [Akkermansiaceae bacterium]|nr:xanthine dehydrogenase family protein molybdopterin-binding subunit [Armatimonadota bacterium]
VGDEVVTKPATQWGGGDMPDPRANGRALVTGGHRYTSDIKRPGMLHGKVLRSPSVNARRLLLDTGAAETMPGATVVRDGDFVGAVAGDILTATRAVEAMRVEWEAADGQPSTHEVFDHLRNSSRDARLAGGDITSHTEGSVVEGLAAADRTIDSTYTVAYIAHAPLEPRAAVAEWNDGRLTVWTGTQRPFGVRGELAAAFGISEERVHVLVPDTGSGYGGKHTGEAAIEAARLARGAGRPVKLVWTRAEEFTHAYFRPAGVIDIRSGVTDDGTLTAWEHHNHNSGASAMRTLYNVPHQYMAFHPAQSPLRQGSYRALAATANHFARETHMDELAHAVGMDPLAFRLNNLQDDRLRAVLEAAAERFGWGTTPRPDHGFGIAGGYEKGSYVATCAEVAVDTQTGAAKVVRAVTAFECGAIIHPDNVRSQVEGAVIMGMGGALFEYVDFADGKIRNPCFSRYRVPRFSDIPILETVLLDRKDLPTVGGGETPIVAIAPAIGNALFQATGTRLRSLPLMP